MVSRLTFSATSPAAAMIVIWYLRDILSRIIEEIGGLRLWVREIVQPAQACPSSHNTGGLLEVGFSNAWTSPVVNSNSERPRTDAVVSQYFRKSRLLPPSPF